jgi:hypothetical protein
VAALDELPVDHISYRNLALATIDPALHRCLLSCGGQETHDLRIAVGFKEQTRPTQQAIKLVRQLSSGIP